MTTMTRKPSELDNGSIILDRGAPCRVLKTGEMLSTPEGNMFLFLLQDLMTGSEFLSGYRTSTLIECR